MDNVLINRAKAGDENAAEFLIRRYYPLSCGTADGTVRIWKLRKT